LHLRQLAPISGQRHVEEPPQRGLQDGLDAALDVPGKLHEVRTILEFDQALYDDVDGIPAKGGESAGRVGWHDGLDAGREFGGLLPVEHRIESHAPLRERRMEIEESVGLASVLAGSHDGTLETLGVFGVEDDDDVAPVDGL